MKDTLAAWDGKRAQVLRDLYERAFAFGEAIALCDDPVCAEGASWLIKYHTERAPLSAGEVQALLDAQRREGAWPLLLHLVQALDRVDLADRDVRHAADVLQHLARHEAPFVRAWSISALARIAGVAPAYKELAAQLIMDAHLQGDKPSVMARLRKAARLLDQS
ncbi:MAG: hypothetical protein AAF891_03220 [Pseudomonadota bacterium]